MIQYIILYFIILFSGDSVMFNLGGFSNLGYFDFLVLLIISVLANLTSDIIFFLIGGKILIKIKFKELEKKKKRVKKFFKRKAVLSIFLSKFIYGTRALTVILLGELKLISLKKFVFYDIFALTIISSVVLSLGYLSYEYLNLIFIDNSLFKAIFVGFVFIVGYIIFRKWKKSVR